MEPKKIIIILDKNNDVWFYGNHITSLMGYKSRKEAITTLVSKENIKKYIEIKNNIKPGMTAPLVQQPKTRFINEEGVKELLNKSKLSTLKGFRYWFNHVLMPKIADIRDKF